MSKTIEVGETYKSRNKDIEVTIFAVDLTGGYPVAGVAHYLPTGAKNVAHYNRYGVHESIDRTNDLIIPEPEPKWRPWKVGEIPVGARIRRKDERGRETLILQNASLFVGAGQWQPCLLFLDGRSSASDAFNDLEYWDGTSWQPCGVLE